MSKKIYLQLFLIFILVFISLFIFIKYFKKTNLEKNLQANIEQTISPNESYIEDLKYLSIDKDGNENFQSIMKEISRKDYTISNGKYQIFDLINIQEFELKKKSLNFTLRLNLLKNILNKYWKIAIGLLTALDAHADPYNEEWNKNIE